MSRLELRIPPPVIGLACAAIMYALARFVPQAAVPLPHARLLALAAATLGALIGLLALLDFRRHRTTFNPHHPDKASALVTDGIYRRTRNPMYLGLLVLLSAWAIFLANAATLLGLVLFVLLLNRLQIVPEERILAEKFGEGFVHYRRAVRRWI